MHELSIAMSIVEGAQEEAARHGCRVTAVHLRIGQLSGVDKDALLFAFGLACEDTVLAGSRLLIEEIPVIIFCSQCAAKRKLPSIQSFSCPMCGAPAAEVVEGRELELVALELGELWPLETKNEHNAAIATKTSTD
jgi:hydrogenase nickel incorporation protein HypA/HybF